MNSSAARLSSLRDLVLSWLLMLSLVACSGSSTATPSVPVVLPSVASTATLFAPTSEPSAVFTATRTPLLSATATLAATAPPTAEPRIFLSSERTNTVQVWQGQPPRFIKAIPVGRFPHNMSVSNSGQWIASANRQSNDISIIDSATLSETARIHAGQAPHDLSWSPDDTRLYVTQERDFFITVIDTEAWKVVDQIRLDAWQHDLAISPDGSQIWATTINYRGLLIIDRATHKIIEKLAYFPHGSHDITFRPDVGEVWVTSSGFIRTEADVDPHIVIFDYQTHQIKDNRSYGLYPFHSIKQYRDGLLNADDTIWFSDRGLGGVILINVRERKVVAEIKTGRAPFHMSLGANGYLYVANHDDATFSVIDTQKREVIQTISVAPDPHGIVVTAAR